MKKILLVIDFQNDFVNGSLGFEGADRLDDLIANRINEYRSNGDEVAFTFDTHSDEYLNTREGLKLPVKHCIKGTNGWELYGKVGKLIQDNDKVFMKPTFGSVELMNYLMENKYDAVELVGLVTNICVVSNAMLAHAALPEAEIIVNSNYVDSYDKELHNKTLDILEGIQITVIR